MMCFFTGASNATTQRLENTGEVKTSKDRLFDLPPRDEIDGVLLDEMDLVYRECLNDVKMSGHLDCKCHAMAFLEERIKTPSIPRGIVKNVIENQCYSPEKMIGHYFGECMAKNTTKRRATEGTDPIVYCKCYANEYTNGIIGMSKIRSTGMKMLAKRAEKTCERR